MKKAFVLLLALAVIGGAAFAEDAAYTLTGSASLTWGYDLDTEAHGFTNATSATLTVPFVATQSATHAKDAISGSVTITDFGYTVSTGGDTKAAGSVTAKILLPSNLYLAIAAAPTFAVANATTFAVWYDPDALYVDEKLVAPTITSAGGFTFGMTGDFNFALCVGSTGKHTSAATAAGTAASALYVATGTEVAATGVSYTTLTGAVQALPLTAGNVYVKVTAASAAVALAASEIFSPSLPMQFLVHLLPPPPPLVLARR